MFKNLIVYALPSTWAKPELAALEAKLSERQFHPCGPTQKSSVGWSSPRPGLHNPLVESIGGQWILQVQAESKSVPGSTLKRELKKRCADIEDKEGRKPGRKEQRELKDEIEQELLPRAFPKHNSVLVWLDVEKKRILVGSTSQKMLDDTITLLVEAFVGLGTDAAISLAQSNTSPATAMTKWLVDKSAPGNFILERDLELRSADESKAAVRYAHHNLEIDEVIEHLRQGKQPTQLALSWNSRVAFTLGADMSIKKINLLDTVFEGQDQADAGFDADVALFTGELRVLLDDLFTVLDGLMDF